MIFLALAGAGCAAEDEPADRAGSGPAALCPAAELAANPAPLRRLTRFEYGRSVQALTGADPSIADGLPPDEESLGFLNNADAYSVSSLHVTKYLELAERIAEGFVLELGDSDPAAFIGEFGLKAWRRPLSDDELEAMHALHEATDLSAVVAAMLQAPQFLYRPEPPSADDYAFATRLSYLIVASTPDAELLAAAADGSLSTAAGLELATERLLADPRALEAFSHFLSQWWDLGALPTIEKDRTLYRSWTSDTPAALAEETRLFVADVWGATSSLEALLSAPFSYVDARLALLYGLPAPSGSGFQRVELDPARASGLLTQGALLATHSKANQTSPVQRGAFVRTRLFCTPPPPPPPDIVVRPPAVDPRLSTRERFAQHSSDPGCATCHELMDPIGFAFEHYDAVGRYRDVDGGKPVDAQGELVGTDVAGTFDGVPELGQRLVASEDVRRCVATQWFRYAFGRGEQTDA
ncbi:MAG TPA: DUF1588 domain-containing protein, partial [Polyangiaceae bacterium]|nr:DUF1588 domain-containing protein [Polyangiaceae bacterium]